MGAWGTGVFENDDALDFVNDYEDDGPAAIKEAFSDAQAAHEAGYLEAPDGARVLAAGEVVAACCGQASGTAEARILKAMMKHTSDVKQDVALVQGALRGVALVNGTSASSELLELWSEGSGTRDLEAWQATVHDLVRRLKAIA